MLDVIVQFVILLGLPVMAILSGMLSCFKRKQKLPVESPLVFIHRYNATLLYHQERRNCTWVQPKGQFAMIAIYRKLRVYVGRDVYDHFIALGLQRGFENDYIEVYGFHLTYQPQLPSHVMGFHYA